MAKKKRTKTRPAKKEQGPTIREVAQRAGVSIGTVSRVIAGTTIVSERLTLRVRQAVQELQYRPNIAARTLRTRSTRLLGCLVSDITNPLYAPIVGAAAQRAHQAGYNLVVAATENDLHREKELLSFLHAGQVDGAVVAIGRETQPELAKLIKHLAIPIVILDREPASGIDAILVDHQRGAFEAASYLIGLGHHHIALITGAGHIRPAHERIDGLKSAFKKHHVDLKNLSIRTECHTAGAAFSETSALLERRDRPTAILSLGSQALSGVLQAIKARGLAVPDDVSVLSIGDTDLAKLVEPKITTLRWNLADVGGMALDLLLQRMSGRLEAEARQLRLPTELILRDSCKAPRKSA